MKSIVLSAFYPESKHSFEAFKESISILKRKDIKNIEFCYYGEEEEKVKDLLKSAGIESIYLGAIPLKEKKLSLSSIDESERSLAVKETMNSIDKAYFYNSTSLLINSGRKPHNNDLKKAKEQLRKSIIELQCYIKENFKRNIIINLETGDQDIDSCETLGPTIEAIEFTRDLRKKYSNFYLTLDTSHLRQLGENEMDSLFEARDCCNHIHFANCIIKDVKSPLFGDKHPEFGVENGEFNLKDMERVYELILKNYSKDITIGTEIIARDHDREQLIINTIANFNWLYK